MSMGKDSFTVEANTELHQEILAARKAGRRYGGKLYSCTLAFELGAKILLGREEPEEESIKQELEEYRIQKAAIEQQERRRVEQLQMMEASRVAKMSEAAEQNNNIQYLAQKIIETWDEVILFKNNRIIDSILDIDRRRLTRSKVEAVFPRRYKDKPTIDEAVVIAVNLLEGECIGS